MRILIGPEYDLWTSRIHDAIVEANLGTPNLTPCKTVPTAPQRLLTPVSLYIGEDEFLDFARVFGWGKELAIFGQVVKVYRVREKNHFHLHCK